MKKNRIRSFITVLLSLCCLICAAPLALKLLTDRLQTVHVLDSALTLLSLEPAEVKSMRKQDVITEEEGHYEYYFRQLSHDQQRAYREMLSSIRNWDDEFYLTIAGDDEIDLVYRAVLNDHPELFWARNRKAVYKTLYTGQNYCSFSPSYSYGGEDGTEKWESDQAREILQSMQDAKTAVAAMLGPDATDYDKAFVIYTYIIENTDYIESEDDQSIAGVFWKREAVCAGYASAMQYLLEAFGVNCIYVEGVSLKSEEGHAWNMVELDGEWYYIDVTNADQPEFFSGDAVSLDEHKTILMDYLCPFPWEYEKDYQPTELFELPECSSTGCNFYVLNNGCFDEYDPYSLNDYFEMRINNNAAVIRFKYSNAEAFEEALEMWPSCDELEESIQYYMAYNGLTQVQYHYGVLDSLYTFYYIF